MDPLFFVILFGVVVYFIRQLLNEGKAAEQLNEIQKKQSEQRALELKAESEHKEKLLNLIRVHGKEELLRQMKERRQQIDSKLRMMDADRAEFTGIDDIDEAEITAKWNAKKAPYMKQRKELSNDILFVEQLS